MAWVARVLSRNWRLKLSATALAVVLWALVRADPSRRGDVFTIPVHAQVGDLGWSLDGDPQPASVDVRVRGSTPDLIRLAREGASLRIPLDSVVDGDTIVQLRRDWVVLGEGSAIVVEDISPASVRLALEPTLSTLVPVRVLITGELPDGMALAAPVGLDPQFVRVRGPQRRVRGVDTIQLRVLELGGVRDSGVYTVAIDTSGLGDLDVTPTEASLAIRLEPATERELLGVPVVAATDSSTAGSDSFVITPPTIPVRLSGARTPVTGTDAAGVRAVVPIEALVDLAPGQERRVAIRLRGVPALVRGLARVDTVTVRRVPRPDRGTALAGPGGR